MIEVHEVYKAHIIKMIVSDETLDKLISILEFVDDPDIKNIVRELSPYREEKVYQIEFCDRYGKCVNNENSPVIKLEEIPF